MNSGISARSVVLLFLAVATLYFAAFRGIEYWRHKNGPWEVTFQSDAAGTPSLVVHQPKRNIAGVELVFPGETVPQTNFSETVAFDRPRVKPPFGTVIYEDLTALPGVVTFDLFGHEIELLPRTLIVNKKQIPWQSGTTLKLSAAEKPAEPPKPPKGSNR